MTVMKTAPNDPRELLNVKGYQVSGKDRRRQFNSGSGKSINKVIKIT